MDGRATRLFTIPPGVSFVDALAAALLAETGADPLVLARYTILLPTRRARRALDEAFLRQSDGRPLLLPRTLPLGDLDPDDVVLAGSEDGAAFESAPGLADLLPPIPALRRQLLLTQAIQAAGRATGEPLSGDQAARLAAELARLLDQVQTEQQSFDRLRDLVPEGAVTRIRWTERGTLGDNPLMGWWALSMERAQSQELGKSLERLEAAAAAGVAASALADSAGAAEDAHTH